MFVNHRWVRQILPDKEVCVFANRTIDKSVSELRFAGPSMFVDHTACRSKETLPTPLPRLVRNVGIFDVKRSVERIKATDCQEFSSIDCARSTPGPENGDGFEFLLARLDLIVPEVKRTSFEFCACF